MLPISDEVNCRLCHASGSAPAAQPTNGWAWNTDPEHDYRLNILRRHDDLKNPATYPGILSSNGYNPQGLYQSVVANGKPVLCAADELARYFVGYVSDSDRPRSLPTHWCTQSGVRRARVVT